MRLPELEKQCDDFLKSLPATDSAHDLAHIRRVVANAKRIVANEDADVITVIAASWLHDCVTLPKNHPERAMASKLAARKAVDFLKTLDFPADKLTAVGHAIEAHSFSAGIQPETTEAKIVQDADRLDALGAIGIARCFAVGGIIDRPLYNPEDPFCEKRLPDDRKWTIDHFYTKLFNLAESMNTEAAKKEAHDRTNYMRAFINQLQQEIS
ncbi:MAG: HD domain-containing protein [Balneolaceae bacterium]|nr:MAG: HD domain-containing protein [Balneolaceae bacterium]